LIGNCIGNHLAVDMHGDEYYYDEFILNPEYKIVVYWRTINLHEQTLNEITKDV
jgi:hypothetical protein